MSRFEKEKTDNVSFDQNQARHYKQWLNLSSILWSIDRWEQFSKDFQDSPNQALRNSIQMVYEKHLERLNSFKKHHKDNLKYISRCPEHLQCKHYDIEHFNKCEAFAGVNGFCRDHFIAY